jgi:hypothetical protein
MWMDRQTKRTVAFRNFANAPKNLTTKITQTPRTRRKCNTLRALPTTSTSVGMQCSSVTSTRCIRTLKTVLDSSRFMYYKPSRHLILLCVKTLHKRVTPENNPIFQLHKKLSQNQSNRTNNLDTTKRD